MANGYVEHIEARDFLVCRCKDVPCATQTAAVRVLGASPPSHIPKVSLSHEGQRMSSTLLFAIRLAQVYFYNKGVVRRLTHLSGTVVPPQMPDTRPDIRQRALFVMSNATCRWNKMLLAELKVDIPRAAIAVAIEHRAR